jgi:hypothetical protein
MSMAIKNIKVGNSLFREEGTGHGAMESMLQQFNVVNSFRKLYILPHIA